MPEKKWFLIGIVLLLGVAIIALFGSNFFSFTLEESAPLTTTQNNLNLSLHSHAFLSDEPISGQLKAVNVYNDWRCGNSQAESPSKGYLVPTQIIFKLNEVVAKTYSIGDGSGVIGHVGVNADPNTWYVGAHPYDTGSTDSCNHPIYRFDGANFSFSVPDQLKLEGGNKELRVYSKNLQTGEETLELVASIYIEPRRCTDASLVTYEEVFKQGTTIRLNPQDPGEVGLRGTSPVLCHTAPIQKQQTDSNMVFAQSTQELELLKNGSAVTVPQGEQWLFFYKASANISGAIECQNNGGVWNADTSQCVMPPTIVIPCNGVLTQDPVCIIRTNDYRCEDPKAALLVPNGSDCSVGGCSCVHTFGPEQTTIDCPTKATISTLPDGSKQCKWPPTAFCPDGKQSSTGECETTPQPYIGSLNNGSVLFWIILILIVVLGGAGFWFFKIKK